MPINPKEIVWDSTPYKWGGKSKSGFDCSGYVCNQLKSAGIDIQDTAAGLAKTAYNKGELSDNPELIGPGSVIFLSNTQNPKHAKNRFKNIHHTGIVVEQDGQLYVSDAQGKRGVGVTPLWDYVKNTASKIYHAPLEAFKPSKAYAADLINPDAVKWDSQELKPDQIIWDDEKPGVGPSITKNILQPEQIEFDTYAEPSQRAGELIKKGIEKTQEYAFLPLNKALTYFHKGVIEPVRQRDITSTTDIPPAGLGAPEAFAPLPTEQEFVPTMEFALAPAYFKLIGKATSLLGRVGKQNFYKYAPDWMFRKGEAGLPEVLPPERIAQIMGEMSGPERAAMARKYPEFRSVLEEWQMGGVVPETAMPTQPVVPGVGAIGRPQVAGELVTPQPKLPPGQGFKFGPQTILRKPPAPEPPPPDYYYPPEELGGGMRVPPESTARTVMEAAEKYGPIDLTPADNTEKLTNIKQMLEDQIAIKKANNQPIPQAHLDRLADVNEQLEGKIPTEGIASNLVFGHPQATNLMPEKYGNLVPIKSNSINSIKQRIEKAQSALDELNNILVKNELLANGKIKGKPSEIKKAKQYISSANSDEDRVIRDLLKEETLPELNRLMKLLAKTKPARGAGVVPEVPSVVKEPWEMTKKEYAKTDPIDPERKKQWVALKNLLLKNKGKNLREGLITTPQWRKFIDKYGQPNPIGGGLFHYFEDPANVGIIVKPTATLAEKRHYAAVSQALSKGKPVPPEVLADYPDLAQTAPEVPKKTTPKKKPAVPKTIKEKKQSAYESGNMPQLIKLYGGFNPKSYIIKANFEPEERRLLYLYSRKNAQGADALLDELKRDYPGVFSEYDNESDFLRALVNKSFPKPFDAEKAAAEYYAEVEENERLAKSENLDEESLANAYEETERNITDERNAESLQSESATPKRKLSQEEIDTFWDDLPKSKDLKYLYSGLPIPNLGKVLNKYFAKVPQKDMNMFARYTEMPFWRAQRSPRGKNVYDVQSNRELERNVAMDEILGEMDDTIKYLKALPKKKFKKINDAAYYFDEYRVEVSDNTLRDKWQFTPEDIAAYRKTREMLEWVREDYFNLLQELGMPRNEIDELRREMGKIPGYIPHRRQGRHEVGASHIDPETGTRVTDYYEQFDDMLASVTGQSLKYKSKTAEIKAKYPESQVWTKPVEEIPEDYFWHVDTQNMQAIIDAAVGKMPGANESLRRELLATTAKTFMQRGFGQHFIKRKNIPGYDKSDFLAATLEHLMGYYGFKTKMRAAKEFHKALTNFPATSKERLYWEKYVRDMLSNTTQWDRVTDKVRAGAFIWFLAGVPRQIILQPTQNFIAGVPVLQQYTKWSSGKILSEMAKLGAGIAKRQRLGHLEEDIRTGIKVAKSKGIIDAQLTHEYEGYLKNTMGKTGEKLSKAAGFFIGNAEIFNRESMYATAYKIAREELKKDHLQSMKFAEDIIKQVHFEYGKKNLPPFARGGDVAKLARTAYTFRTFNHNLFNLYYDLGKKGTKGGEGILKGLGYLLLFGGLSSLPFWKDLESYYQRKTGKNIRSEIRKEFPAVGRYLNQGIPALAGIDLSASMGIESIQDWKEALGVPYSMVQMPMRAAEQFGRKDYYRGIEDIAPSVIKGPMAAYRQYTKGVTTRRGKPILDDQGKPLFLTGPEAIARGLSFQTPKLTEAFQKYEARNEVRTKWNDERKELIETHRLAKLNYGVTSEEAKDALQDIQEFNKRLREEKIRFIPPITMKTLKGRPETKREKALRKEYK